MTRAIIIHGTKGSPEGNWFPWLASELQRLGIETRVPEMPTPDEQSLASWHAAFKRQCGAIDQGTILIGHSTGAVFVLRLLEELSVPVLCSVFVSPPGGDIGIPEYDALNASFFSEPFRWPKIKSNAGRMALLMGDDDPYVPQHQLLAIAKALDLMPTIINSGGHLNSESGFTSFPLLLEILNSFLRNKRS